MCWDISVDRMRGLYAIWVAHLDFQNEVSPTEQFQRLAWYAPNQKKHPKKANPPGGPASGEALGEICRCQVDVRPLQFGNSQEKRGLTKPQDLDRCGAIMDHDYQGVGCLLSMPWIDVASVISMYQLKKEFDRPLLKIGGPWSHYSYNCL